MIEKTSFYASLFENGLLGGAAYLDEDLFRFVCQKATVDKELRDIRIPYLNIRSVRAENKNLFPLTTIETDYGKSYRFLIFNRRRFIDLVNKMLNKTTL